MHVQVMYEAGPSGRGWWLATVVAAVVAARVLAWPAGCEDGYTGDGGCESGVCAWCS